MDIISKLHISFKSKTLSNYDISFITTLLLSGYDIDFILSLVKEKRNAVIIESITDQLKQGIELASFLPSVLPKQYRHYFDLFIKVLPLAEALKQSEMLIQKKKETTVFWLKNVFPSLALLCIALLGMGIFKHYGIPMITNLALSFHQELSWLQPLDTLLSIGLIAFVIVATIVIIFFISLANQRFYLEVAKLISRLSPSNLLIMVPSYDFAIYFHCCFTAGLKTLETLQLLQQMKHPLIPIYASRIIDALQKGTSFESSLKHSGLDRSLCKFLTLSMYSGNSRDGLQAYIISAQALITKRLKLLGKALQIFCYSAIGGLIICIYQVLFVPMQIISTL